MLGRFKKEPISKTVQSGEVHRFFCKLSEAVPAPLITWVKDGVEIGSNEVIETKVSWRSDELLLAAIRRRNMVLPDGTIEINPVLAQDAGSYHCVAKNKARSRSSLKAMLTVLQGKSQM